MGESISRTIYTSDLLINIFRSLIFIASNLVRCRRRTRSGESLAIFIGLSVQRPRQQGNDKEKR